MWGGKPLNELDASDAARLIADGEIGAEQLVRACLDRISEREPAVKAWACIDPENAIRQARACDRASKRGLLHGVPVAVKDVIDTVEMPTEMGSVIYAGYCPKADAGCVADVKEAGAVVLGKSVTCEFAGMTSGATTNPHDASRTPGGSSSGSAAAVADFMVPLAYGTQTGGSIVRPASYCGIVGFKPTYNSITRSGLKFAAETLDTIGFMARSVRDVALMWRAHVGQPSAVTEPRRRATVGYYETHLWNEKADDGTRRAMEWAREMLVDAGAEVETCEFPAALNGVLERRNVIDNVERAAGMGWEIANHWDRISPVLQERLEIGRLTTVDTYVEAKKYLDLLRGDVDRVLSDFDFVIVPAVNGEAPIGLGFTGDPSFQSIWTALHVPAITIPAVNGPAGLPVGVQLITARWRDFELLAAAEWAAERFKSARHHNQSDAG